MMLGDVLSEGGDVLLHEVGVDQHSVFPALEGDQREALDQLNQHIL